jgi:hypothetical protein
MREWFTGGFMNKFRWQIAFGVLLTFLSLLIYFLHYVIFRDSHHIFKYGLHELAFVPIEVLVVTLIIDQLLKVHEKRSMLSKMNMVIGTFFTEVGAGLLRLLAGFDGSVDKLKDHFLSPISSRIRSSPPSRKSWSIPIMTSSARTEIFPV